MYSPARRIFPSEMLREAVVLKLRDPMLSIDSAGGARRLTVPPPHWSLFQCINNQEATSSRASDSSPAPPSIDFRCSRSARPSWQNRWSVSEDNYVRSHPTFTSVVRKLLSTVDIFLVRTRQHDRSGNLSRSDCKIFRCFPTGNFSVICVSPLTFVAAGIVRRISLVALVGPTEEGGPAFGGFNICFCSWIMCLDVSSEALGE